MICPCCGAPCQRDEVDVGVGTITGPWGCPDCGWVEAQPELLETLPMDEDPDD